MATLFAAVVLVESPSFDISVDIFSEEFLTSKMTWLRPSLVPLYPFSFSTVTKVLVGYKAVHQTLHFPTSLAVYFF